MLLKSFSRSRLYIPILQFKNNPFKMSTTIENKSNVPEGCVEIIEGTARMIYDQKEAVFYNKVQVLNRDLSIQVIRLFSETVAKERKEKYDAKLKRYLASTPEGGRAPFPVVEGISVLDALAATGLRSIRYVKEIPLLREIAINDLLEEATKAAAENCRLNNVDQSKVKIHNRDATLLMYEHRDSAKQFDVVDLDPYGSACPFLDSAVQAVSGDGGLLIVTCTDMAVLAGSYSEVCFSKYGSVSIRAGYMHEMALRILLNAIESSATKYKRFIVPWLSLSVDFYVRVFVRVYESAAGAKESCLRRSMVYQSSQCPSFYMQPLATGKKNGAYTPASQTVPSKCPETDGSMKVAGPFWSEPIHRQEVVDEILRRVESGIEGTTEEEEEAMDTNEEVLLPFPVPTAKRLTGILSSMSEELKDVPFYYDLTNLATAVESKSPTHIEFKSALLNAGYRVSHFHHEPNAMKTDAPPNVIWDIMRAYCKLHPPTGSTKKKQSDTAAKILSVEPTIDVSFKIHESLYGSNLRKKVARFPPNPEANWGPKRRAGRPQASEDKAQQEREERKTEREKKLNEKREQYRQSRAATAEQQNSGSGDEEPAVKKAKASTGDEYA